MKDDSNKPIAKVIRILDDETLVINAGSNQYIHEGQKLVIYEEGETLKDPDTGKTLGTLDYIKARVEVVNTYSNFSTVKSLSHYTEKVNTGVMSAFTDRTKEVHKTKVNKLPVEQSQIKKQVIKNKKIIIGDLVKNM